ncbi:conserved hypothetical protein [Azospirillaceae bacterium]
MAHECSKEDFLGRVAEFMDNMKGFKATLFAIALAIVLQVGTFLYLWGGLTTTVAKNSEQIWCKLTPTADQNAKNIAILLEKFKNVKLIGYHENSANAEPEKDNNFK